MIILLEGLFDKCSKDAFLCFVIGQSKIHGEIIENEKLIKTIGEQTGFGHFTTIKRAIRQGRKSFNLSHARIKEEFIVILQK
jgi:site-specific DNA-methyltransferase (cytosine-N4-specific)